MSGRHLSDDFFFECFICKEKADDPANSEEFTYPVSELANSEELDDNFLMCRECDLDLRHEMILYKYDEDEYGEEY